MDDAGAAVIGAAIAFAGVGLNVVAQEVRARRLDRRADSERVARTRGMTRMVGAELNEMHTRVKHAPFDDLVGFDRSILSTRAWERYGPDICVELPLKVVDKLLTAYSVVDAARSDDGGLPEEVIADARQVQKGRWATQWRRQDRRHVEGIKKSLTESRNLLMRQREQLLKALADGYTALQPYFDVRR